MARRSTRFTVGRQRVGKTVRPSEAAYTRQIRAQMKHIEDTISNLVNAIEGLTPGALEYGVQPIFDKSQYYVPVKTQALKDSGFIEAEVTSRGARAVVAYGKGGEPAYGVFVHEMVDNYHAPPTQAKFLEQAANEHMEEVPGRVAEFLRRRTGLR